MGQEVNDMKKSILLITAVCAASCALSACGKKKVNAYDNLNSMVEASYSQVTISVNNTFTQEDVTLESVYTLIYNKDQVTVQYKVERFNDGLSLDSPDTDVKTTLSGTAVIVGDSVTGGNDVGLTADIASLSFEFKEEYFANVTIGESQLTADVTNTSGFLGTKLTCTNMKVNAQFSDVFESITITYKQGLNEVEYSYIFTR